MILLFGAQLGYENFTNTFILSKNLASALINTEIIDKKLINNFVSSWVKIITDPRSWSLFLLFGLISNYYEDERKFYYLLYMARH